MGSQHYNIFWHELRSHRQSIAVWSVSISAISIMFILLYPAYSKDVEAIKQVLANYPPALLKALSLNVDVFFSFLGFYSYITTYIIMAGAVQALNLGINTIAKESTDKTADFLLAKPNSRQNIITQKLFANICILLITNVVFVVATFIAAKYTASRLSIGTFLLLAATLLFTQIVFLAIGTMISSYANKVKSVVSISLPIVFGFYIIGSFYSIFDISLLQYFSLLRYFDSSYIITHGYYQMSFLLIALSITALCTAISYIHYSKKDINVS